jgi:hypothetical protein
LIPNGYKHEEEIKLIEKQYTFIKIIYWDKFLKYLYEKDVGIGSSIIQESLEYFRNIILPNAPIDTKFSTHEVAIMFNPKDLFDALSFLDKFHSLNDKVIKKVIVDLNASPVESFHLGSPKEDIEGQGKYIRYKNEEIIFLGLNPSTYEEDNGKYVFSLALRLDKLKEDYIIDPKYSYTKDDPNDSDTTDAWVYIALDRKILLDENQEDRFAEAVIDIIKNVFLKNYVE